MTNILPFRARTATAHDDVEDAEDVDLLTAVDAVIRELRDIAHGRAAVCPAAIGEYAALLERAYRRAIL